MSALVSDKPPQHRCKDMEENRPDGFQDVGIKCVSIQSGVVSAPFLRRLNANLIITA